MISKHLIIGMILLPAIWISCQKRNKDRISVSKQVLAIEREQSIEELYSKTLSHKDQKRLQTLEKELKALSQEIQKPLLSRAKASNRNQAIAIIYMNHGMFFPAIKHLDEAIRNHANNTALFYFRGLCSGLLMKNERDPEARKTYLQQAIWDYRRSLEINPEFSNSLYGLAVIMLFEKKDYYEASQLLDRYIAKRNIPSQTGGQKKSKSSKDINALFMRAQSAYGQSDSNQAIYYYEWIEHIASTALVLEKASRLKSQILQQREK